ncbi:class I SAM-dependent methyltransferase [Paenibacillus sp. NPDC056579]|uniref:class I SAM-dependent methyltransferase n=1 Tax=Paenibacillus sp. NPDC056579 TaxID=3345871 RepID=UPI0036B34042
MSQFDAVANKYIEHAVKKGAQWKPYAAIVDELAKETAIAGKTICDIGCGPGILTGKLRELGGQLTGVDSSEILLNYASSQDQNVHWIHDDAMTLSQLREESFDIVVSSLMLMDVPDHRAVFRQSLRILKPGGLMIWLIMHPCFQSPFSEPLEGGGHKVVQYAPQYWKSEGEDTFRSIAGSHHRPISDYVNDFMNAGFELQRLFEPGAEQGIPAHFGAVGRKSASDGIGIIGD